MISPVLVKKNQIKSDYLGEVIFDLLSQTFGLPKEFDFNVLVVSKEYIARPDLIALDAYGDTMFADVICKVNGISNPFELNEGMYLILPVYTKWLTKSCTAHLQFVIFLLSADARLDETAQVGAILYPHSVGMVNFYDYPVIWADREFHEEIILSFQPGVHRLLN